MIEKDAKRNEEMKEEEKRQKDSKFETIPWSTILKRK